MANWYITEFTLSGAPEDVDAAENLLKGLSVDSCGELQLVEFAEALDCDPERTFYAGYIESDTIIRDGDRIGFITWTKWQAPYQVIYALCQRYSSLSYYFLARLEIYATNDAEGRFYPNRVYVELSQGDTIEEKGFPTVGKALVWVNESTGRHFASEDEATQYFHSDSSEDDSFCIFHHVNIIGENKQLTFIPQKNSMNLSLYTPDGSPAGEITVTIGDQN